MLSNTMTVLLGADSYTLRKINEGNYTSEYMVRDSLCEVRLRIRHTKERATGGAQGLDRHNVELTKRVFPQADVPEKTYSAYIVIRNDPNGDGSEATILTEALNGVVSQADFIPAILNWES